MQQTHPLKYHDAWKKLCSAKGVIVPGGFGSRGISGMILAAQYARENRIPYLGLCLGMQIAVIEYARNVCLMADANSEEFDKDAKYKAIVFMPEISKTQMGGTMRLGDRATRFVESSSDSISKLLYGNNQVIHERHRHRYEVNPELVPEFEKAGLFFVGQDELRQRMIIMELKSHPFYVATQFHPEYKTRPLKPSPLFLGFILASCGLLEDFKNPTKKDDFPVLGRYKSMSDLLGDS